MSDATTSLFDLPGFRVVRWSRRRWDCDEWWSQVVDEPGCPRCGVLVGGKPYDVRKMRVKNLPLGTRPLLVRGCPGSRGS